MHERSTGARLHRVRLALVLSVPVGLLVSVGLALRPTSETEAGGAVIAAQAEPPTPEEVAAQAGFAVLWPMVLPSGAIFVWGGAGRDSFVELIWHRAATPAHEPLMRLVEAEGSAPLDSPGRAVTVRGQAGRLVVTPLALEGAASGAERQRVNVQWEEAGLALSLTSSALSVAELLHVADRLRPLPPTRARYREVPGPGREGERVAVGRPEAFPSTERCDPCSVGWSRPLTRPGLVAATPGAMAPSPRSRLTARESGPRGGEIRADGQANPAATALSGPALAREARHRLPCRLCRGSSRSTSSPASSGWPSARRWC